MSSTTSRAFIQGVVATITIVVGIIGIHEFLSRNPPSSVLAIPPTATTTPTPNIKIIEPSNGKDVGDVIVVSGVSSNVPKNAAIWVFTMQATVSGERRFWPQRYDGTGAIAPLMDGAWSGKAFFSASDAGRFEIWAMITDSSINKYFEDYIDSNTMRTPIPILGLSTGPPPFEQFIASDSVVVSVRGK